ncbi:MAG: arsenic metallochaperone ArsD family protein [Dermabacter sp.]|nr:arsenic metallochaperone ArsD family protein [Dermabacter sp.]
MAAESSPERNTVDIFVGPPPPAGSEDAREHADLLEAVGRLQADGYPVHVYARGADDWAFADCTSVAEILEINGDAALPITLMAGEIFGMYAYPSEQKVRRLADTPASTPSQPTNACAPTSRPATSAGPSAPPLLPKDSPAAALFRPPGAPARPTGPDIGVRRNLMGGDTGQGLPSAK